MNQSGSTNPNASLDPAPQPISDQDDETAAFVGEHAAGCSPGFTGGAGVARVRRYFDRDGQQQHHQRSPYSVLRT